MDFFTTHISKSSFLKVQEVLATTFLSEGKLVEQFEQKIEEKLGLKNVVAVNSGTTALHLALILAGVETGDEVILPSQTFIATGLVILMVGAIPIFADIDKTTGNIGIDSIKKKISPKTKAIIPVHWAGYPCEMDEIISLSNEYDIKVIEDAAHAFGAKYKEKAIGSISDFTCFSFQAIKHITTGDGGAVVVKDDSKYLQAKRLRWFGIDRANSKVSFLGERDYNVKEIGYKYHLNDYAAALGLANLEDLEFILSRREEIYEYYKQNIKQSDFLTFLNYSNQNRSAYWLFTILVKDRERFVNFLKSKGIPTSVVHVGIHKNDVFSVNDLDLKNQIYFDNHQISIPLHSNLTESEIKHIVTSINQWNVYSR
jgi:perosamine synthetase